ncbi:MAG: RidA family protein [Reyranellaceae bacterium]
MTAPIFVKDIRRASDTRPMCDVVKAGDFLFLSGQVGFDEQRRIVGPGDIEAQARQIFTNVRRKLGLFGCDLTSIVRLTSYLTTPMTDMTFTEKYWTVRREFFGDHTPASTGVQVASLMLPGLVIEVDVTAYAPGAVPGPEAIVLNPAAKA